MQLTNKGYNTLKLVALVVLPALGTLYFALAGIWGLPSAEQIVGSITAVDTFLGAALHLSSSAYKPAQDGELVVDKSHPEKDVYSLNLSTPVDDLDKKDLVTLKVTGGTS